jgi:prophage endopeptidase
MTPTMQHLKLMILALAVVVSFGAGYRWRDLGAKADAEAVQTEHAKEVAEYEKAAREASERAAAESEAKQAAIAALDEKHTRELENAKLENSRLAADLESGAKRLSVLVKSKKAGCPTSGNNPAATSVDNGSERAELDPQASKRIVGITDDGDNAIRQLTACQEYVKEIQKKKKK